MPQPQRPLPFLAHRFTLRCAGIRVKPSFLRRRHQIAVLERRVCTENQIRQYRW
jgi:hypothetical protein